MRPVGYPAFLKLLPTDWELAVVPAVQHLFGLAIAVLLYALLVRLGVPKTWSALATAPVLLDGYQLNIEQYILSRGAVRAAAGLGAGPDPLEASARSRVLRQRRASCSRPLC